MRIKSHTSLLHLGMTAASAGALGLPGTFLYLMTAEGRGSLFVYVIMAPFLLVGLLLGFFGIRGLVRLAVWGRWQIEVPEAGGVLGRPLTIRLLPGRVVAPDGELEWRLRCVQTTGASNKQGRSDRVTLWESRWSSRSGTLNPNVGVDMQLPLPDSGNGTRIDRGTGGGIQWQLNVVVPSNGGSEESVFDVPIRQH